MAGGSLADESGSEELAALVEHGLLNYLVGAAEDRRGNRETQRPSGPEVDDELELSRLLHGQVGDPGALEDPIDIDSGVSVQLGRGDGSQLEPLELPQDYCVLLALSPDTSKDSTAAVYRAFDERGGAEGWEERRDALERALATTQRSRDLAALPPNDLASSPLAERLRELGAFRADVTGAGPAVYGLFHHRRQAVAARRALGRTVRTWLTVPVWYG